MANRKKEDAIYSQDDYKYGFHDDIESIIGLKEWKNIFIYLFARYIKYNAEHLSKVDNAFIAQVMQNLIMLKKGQLKEPAKSQFTAGIKELVDLLSE